MNRLIITSLFLCISTAISGKENFIFDRIPPIVLSPDNETLETIVSDPDKEYSRFSQHQDNIVLFDYLRGPESARHMDVSTSFRYLMTDRKLDQEVDWAVFLAYTGEFDFFANSRPSGPVVSTRNNPALHASIYFPKRSSGLLEWRFSLEHESNGQSTNNDMQLESQRVNFRSKYDRPDLPNTSEIEQMARETISRSNNFVSAGGAYQFNSTFPIDFHFKFRHQLSYGLEDQIWWDYTQSHIQLEDFVGTEMSIDSSFIFFKMPQSVILTYRTGQLFGGNPGRNNTFDFKYFIDIPLGKVAKILPESFALPFVFSCHTGYLEEFYRYSEKSSYCTVGLHARY